ncbi:MAG: HAD-IA family hydrolase [Rhodobacteraceae bacterium]|nr:HAD-IA family hydrolase [Paracoccaceae bacterium]
MSRFAAAIFDLDGTLLDTERPIVDTALSILAARGHPVTRAFLLSLVGIDVIEGNRRLAAHLGPEVDVDSFTAEWNTAARAAMADGIALKPGVAALLDTLAQQGLPRAVATNSATQAAQRKLGLAGLSHHFDAAHVVGYDAVARPKPAADVYLMAAARLGVAPSACVAFEDSAPGVAAALAAGMTVVHVPDMLPARMEQATAHHLAGSILDGARACGLIA